MRIVVCLRNDLRLQWRHGILGAYALVTVFYVAVLFFLPREFAAGFLPLAIFSEPGMVGLFFVGGLVLFERRDRTLATQFVTPLGIGEYLLSKTLTLTGLGTGAGLLMAWAARVPVAWGWLATGALLTAALFTLAGLGLAVRARTVNGYLFGASLLMLPLSIPFAAYFDWVQTPWMWLVPSHASLVMLRAAAAAGPMPWAAAAAAAFWIALAAAWAGSGVAHRVASGGEGWA